MQEEILSLRLRISEQEEVLKGTIQRLRSTSRTKESMEHFIVNQCKYIRATARPGETLWAHFTKMQPVCKSLQTHQAVFIQISANNPEKFQTIIPVILLATQKRNW